MANKRKALEMALDERSSDSDSDSVASDDDLNADLVNFETGKLPSISENKERKEREEAKKKADAAKKMAANVKPALWLEERIDLVHLDELKQLVFTESASESRVNELWLAFFHTDKKNPYPLSACQ
jgi:hypothetical protein